MEMSRLKMMVIWRISNLKIQFLKSRKDWNNGNLEDFKLLDRQGRIEMGKSE